MLGSLHLLWQYKHAGQCYRLIFFPAQEYLASVSSLKEDHPFLLEISEQLFVALKKLGLLFVFVQLSDAGHPASVLEAYKAHIGELFLLC